MIVQKYKCDKCRKPANVRVRVKMEKIKKQKSPKIKMSSKDLGHYCERCAKKKFIKTVGGESETR